MNSEKYVLGIDTSNYKTSVALVSRTDIICDYRKFLEVKHGERGLRQSEAFFQHVRNLPDMFERIREFQPKGSIEAIAFSSAPRPVEGSYMPCFMAGAAFARSMGAMLDVPVISFSHQEGHIEAIKHFSEMLNKKEIIACHFSGGTCEVLSVKEREKAMDIYGFKNTDVIKGENLFYELKEIGGSKDISMGQVLDRAGVLMDMDFPAGAQMDEIAMTATASTDYLTPVKVKDCRFNMSGIDTQIKNRYTGLIDAGEFSEEIKSAFIHEIFTKLSDAAYKMLKQAAEAGGTSDILMSGGVSSSRFIRKAVTDKLRNKGINIYFDERDLSSDNAVGTALLGGRYIWD